MFRQAMSAQIFVPMMAPTFGESHARLRLLDADDPQTIERHLLALALVDRHSRFLGKVSDGRISDYVRGLDPSDVVLIGAFDAGDRLVGLVESHRTHRFDTVEVSISIDLTHRRQGLGRRLFMRLLAQIFDSGTKVAEFLSRPGNVALFRLVCGLGGHSGGEPGHVRISRTADIVMPEAA
jgi:GNAT superfamily N-acetyltransferase